jgi:hypothetical protein
VIQYRFVAAVIDGGARKKPLKGVRPQRDCSGPVYFSIGSLYSGTVLNNVANYRYCTEEPFILSI